MNELAIPLRDKEDFGKLAPAVKGNLKDWLKCVAELDAAAGGGRGEVGDSQRSPLPKAKDIAAVWASKFGCNVNYVFSKRSLFRKHGWRALLDKRAAGADFWDRDEITLPTEAQDHLKKLFGDFKRSNDAAIRAFVRQWRRWKNGDLSARIPGFAECPEGGYGRAGDHPRGWSDRNLKRYLPSRYELLAERRGQNYAVGKCGPQTFTTRSGLHYMSHVMLDDVWHDNFVVFKGKGICRVVELDALDVFSGALVFWGCKPRLKRDDGTFDQSLQKYVPLALAGMLATEGYSPRGTIFMAEHGTAAVPERIKAMFRDYFPEGPDGKSLVQVRESGITGEEQAIIGWRGQGKGNSRFKACLESHHHLKHNELSYLPGQTGLDRNTRPEQTHGILQADSDLLKAMEVLAVKHPQRAAQLRTRLLDYHSAFVPVLSEVYRIINERDWHALEGWDAIPGNIQIEYRMAPTSGDWLSDEDFRRLPDVSQDALIAAAAEDQRYLRRRRISPAAVARRERGGLVKIPDWILAEMIGFDFAYEVKVGGAYFNLFMAAEVSLEPLRFESVVVTPEGKRWQLPDDKYLVLLNPFDPMRLFVHDAKQRFLGVAMREVRVDRFDAEQLRAAWGHQAKRLKELNAPLIKRHQADIREETKRLKHNADLLTTPEVKLTREIEEVDVVGDQLERSAELQTVGADKEEWD